MEILELINKNVERVSKQVEHVEDDVTNIRERLARVEEKVTLRASLIAAIISILIGGGVLWVR